MEDGRVHRRKRLVLVTYPLQGHTNPMLDLASILHSKGFSITIVHTNFNPPNPSNHPDFTFLPISDGISHWDVSPLSLVDLASTINRNCKAPFKECLSQMMRQQEQDDDDYLVVCVIYDFLMHFAESVANEMSLPSIILRTSNAATLLALCTIPQLRAHGHVALEDSRSNDLVPGLRPLRYKDLPISSMGNLENFSQLLSVVCNSRTSSAIIWNTIDCLENSSFTKLQGHYQIPFFQIGPMHKMAPAKPTCSGKESNNCIDWLEKQAPKSVLYVSLGSIAKMDEKEVTEMAWGLASSNQPFLWVIRPGSVSGSEDFLPEGFQELAGNRACIVKWAPQKKILAHDAVGAFWSHCGWNSTLESMCEGVPMICKPYFADQMVNARYLTHEWGVGIELGDAMEREEVSKAVRRVLLENEGIGMRQRAIAMKEQIKVCMEEGGSSHSCLNNLIQFILSF